MELAVRWNQLFELFVLKWPTKYFRIWISFIWQAYLTHASKFNWILIFFYHHGNPNIAGWIDLLHQKLSLNVQVTFWFENKETSCQFSVRHMAWSEKKSAHETICIVIFKRSGCYKETGSIVLQNALDWSLSLPPFVTLESGPNWVYNNWIGTQWQLTYPQCSCRRLSAFRFFNFRSLMLPIDLACVYIHLTSFCSGG